MRKARTLKRAFFHDEELAEVSVHVRYTFIGIINNADDEGRMRSPAAWVKSVVYPYDDDMTPDIIEHHLQALHNGGFIRLYGTGRQRYLVIPNFLKHQYIKRPQPSELPAPGGQYPIITCGTNEPVHMQGNPATCPPPDRHATAAVLPERKGKERKGSSSKNVIAPTTNPATTTTPPADDDDGAAHSFRTADSPASAADWISRNGAKLATVLTGDADGVAEQLYLAHRRPHPAEKRRYELAKWEAAIDAFVERVRAGKAPDGNPVGYIIGMVPGAGINATINPAALGADNPDSEASEAAKHARWAAIVDEARNAYNDGGAA